MIKQKATLPSFILLAVIAMLTITACTSEPQIGAPDSTPVEQKKPAESSTIQSNEESSHKYESSCPPDLTPNECLTLASITLIDDHPLYTMRYQASYDGREPSRAEGQNENQTTEDALQWGCSLFAAFADNDNLLFGRNFDWRFSPAI